MTKEKQDQSDKPYKVYHFDTPEAYWADARKRGTLVGGPATPYTGKHEKVAA